jgi:hypothetical protein
MKTVPNSKRPADVTAPETGVKTSSDKPGAPTPKRSAKAGASTKRPAKSPKKSSAGRSGTKTAKILTLLRRPAGASLAELRKATGWQAHSVRGFLSGALKKIGLRAQSVQSESGERVYRLTAK